MTGTSHSAFWWFRLTLLKLATLASIQREAKLLTGCLFDEEPDFRILPKSSLPFRKRSHYTTQLLSLLRDILATSQGDDFRTIRALHYFLEAFPKRSTTIELESVSLSKGFPKEAFKIIPRGKSSDQATKRDDLRLNSINDQIIELWKDIARRTGDTSSREASEERNTIETNSLLWVLFQNLESKIRQLTKD